MVSHPSAHIFFSSIHFCRSPVHVFRSTSQEARSVQRVVHSELDFSNSSVNLLIEFSRDRVLLTSSLIWVCCDATIASCGVALEPVAVEEVRIDVVADAMGVERRGVGARFDGIPFADAFEGGFLVGERGTMPGGRGRKDCLPWVFGLPRKPRACMVFRSGVYGLCNRWWLIGSMTLFKTSMTCCGCMHVSARPRCITNGGPR